MAIYREWAAQAPFKLNHRKKNAQPEPGNLTPAFENDEARPPMKTSPPPPKQVSNHADIARQLEALLDLAIHQQKEPRARRFIAELLEQGLLLGAEHDVVPDLKLVAVALAEIREALTAFRPYPGCKKVTVFGSARTKPGDQLYQLATELGRRLAQEGYMVITGAGPGIMTAAHEGAGRAQSFGVGIHLPFEQDVNLTVAEDPKMVEFRYFFTRKLFFLKEAEAVVVFPGGFGTHDEAFETLTLIQTGKAQMLPVIFIDQPGGGYWQAWEEFIQKTLFDGAYVSPEDRSLYRIVSDVEGALEEISNFYRVYHSSRTIRRQVIIRLKRPASSATLETLSEEFFDILGGRPIQTCDPFKEEADQPELIDLPRIRLRFDHRSYGQLRRLIDRLNELEASA